LAQLGQDIRLILPNYRSLKLNDEVQERSSFEIGLHKVRILETILPESSVPVFLVDCPELFGIAGNPYVDTHGHPYSNNAERFALR
ncbi:starch synthase, partial [Citrobacter sp. AAK_AS5]